MENETYYPDWQYRSAVPGLIWPAVPDEGGAAALDLLYQFERSQWLSAAQLLERQLTQLEQLLAHAYSSVPWYREHWGAAYDPALPLTVERFSALPRITRRDLQENFQDLTSTGIPASHGATTKSRSSGSTGTPVRVLKTGVTALAWRTITLRDHIWHRRDFRGTLAAIRHGLTPGISENWGSATQGLVETGPSFVRGIRSSVEKHLRWIEEIQPEYLMTYPSMAAELARTSLVRGTKLTRLREIRTVGEALGDDLRDLCRRAWAVPVIDQYSSEETGYIALQCPEHEHYHVQSEDVLVEILDDRGKPCAPGRAGRVVVTTLHNFATPLIRYELGDYAEPGEPCPCGRGLPVIRRILGRVRNTLITASGERFWPAIGGRSMPDSIPIRQMQLVQKDYDLIEAKLVTEAPLTPDQENAFRQFILARLPAGLRLEISYCENIPRSAGGKFEDFVSEIRGPRP